VGDELVCPYDKCGKGFAQPLLLTDDGKLPRETYYACPHCFSKVDLILDDGKDFRTVKVMASVDVEVRAPVEKKPENCLHHLGFLKLLPEDEPIPEECLVCPKIMECFVRQRSQR
jgi:hypothetical protein